MVKNGVSLVFLSFLLVLTAPYIQGLPYGQMMTDVACDDYLVKYGFASQYDRYTHQWPQARRRALVFLQMENNLPRTGVIDDQTRTIMGDARCGVREHYASKRRKRYVLYAYRYRNPSLTYRLRNYDTDLTRKDIDDIVADSFKQWSDVSRLTFRRVTGNPHIDITFARRSHGDRDPFDGKGGTLAHALFPPYSDVHLDADETFLLEKNVQQNGHSLSRLVVHEVGHALGLEHSRDSRAIMYARYSRNRVGGDRLHRDDINGIQALYGENPNGNDLEPNSRTTTSTSTSTTSTRRATTTTTPTPTTSLAIPTTTTLRRFIRPTTRPTPRRFPVFPEFTTRRPFNGRTPPSMQRTSIINGGFGRRTTRPGIIRRPPTTRRPFRLSFY